MESFINKHFKLLEVLVFIMHKCNFYNKDEISLLEGHYFWQRLKLLVFKILSKGITKLFWYFKR